MIFNIKKNLIFFLFFIFAFFLSVQRISGNEEIVSEKVKKIAEKAFSINETEKAVLNFEKEMQKLKTSEDKIAALQLLADYEDRSDLFSSAASNYIKAAKLSPESLKKNFFLKAFCSYLLGDLLDEALNLFTAELKPRIKSSSESEDSKAFVYYEWLKIKCAENDKDFADAVNTLKKYVTEPVFSEFHPAILLTLWWVDGDKKAENTLLKKFPNSVEAQVVKGDFVLSARTFWYLMPRSAYIIDDFNSGIADDLTANNESEDISSQPILNHTRTSSAKIFQTGFFKTEDYAKALNTELLEKGFSSIVKQEKRSSGTFYSVLVKADDKGDIILRLKSAGYEAVPIFE